MTRNALPAPVSDHAVLDYLERVCGVDVAAARREIAAATAAACAAGARGCKAGGLVYRLRHGYVTTVLVGEPPVVQQQHRAAAKKILRKAKNIPILVEE